MLYGTNIRKGQELTCKYPLHGTRNVLKRHTGIVESVGSGQGGFNATIRSESGAIRTLSLNKMVDLSVS
jgi:hypothetical protein|tara:strand:- start:707 stop:913 length:207 start_codon:yes stop_codon:yes gene_type:complete